MAGSLSNAGTSWTREQDEQLRLDCAEMARKQGRTWGAVKARIDTLHANNWHVKWPDNPAAPTAYQIMQDPASAYLFLRQQLGAGVTVSMTDAAKELEIVGLPYHFGVVLVEQLHKKGWVTVAEGKRAGSRVVTVMEDGPNRPGPRFA